MTQKNLNEKQVVAVNHYEGPMLVLAGPGSGKTMVITHRIQNLIKQYNVDEREILVITFTKAAAEEMKIRFNNLYSDVANSLVSFGTFHSVFYRILRSYYSYNMNNILKEHEKYNLFKKIITDLEIRYEDEQEFIAELQNEMSLMKNELIDVKYYNATSCSNEDYRKIFDSYEGFKKSKNLIDFDDMLCNCYNLLRDDIRVLKFWQKRYKFILVDEFQDINRVQYEIIKMLASDKQNIFVVGDDDQSIYSFRGARPEYLMEFPNDFNDAKKVILDINYRSNKNIIKMSNRVIKNNVYRYEKDIQAFKDISKDPTIINVEDTEQESIKIAETFKVLNNQGIDFNDMAVIFRTNIQARSIVDIFLDYNIPFILRDQVPSIYDHWISKDIIAYMHLSLDRNDNDSAVRIINKPKRYISKYLVNDAKTKSGSLIDNIISSEFIKKWQITRVEELDYDCNMIKGKNPYEAIKFIRKTIGYDEYLKQYAEYRRIGVKGLKEVLDEIQESTKNFDSICQWLHHIEQVKEEIKNIDDKQKYKQNDVKSVTLSTMHGAKGLEFQVVWIAGTIEGIIPHEKSITDEEIEEERRLFYVGLTRAKEHLYISTLQKRYEEEAVASRFLDEIEEKLSISDVKCGDSIKHKEYGVGIIRKLNNNIAHVKFENYSFSKKIDIKYCMSKKIITK